MAFVTHLRFAYSFAIEMLVTNIHARPEVVSPAQREGSGRNSGIHGDHLYGAYG